MKTLGETSGKWINLKQSLTCVNQIKSKLFKNKNQELTHIGQTKGGPLFILLKVNSKGAFYPTEVQVKSYRKINFNLVGYYQIRLTYSQTNLLLIDKGCTGKSEKSLRNFLSQES